MNEIGGVEGLYAFALQEGVRSLEHQQQERTRIRDRAVATLGLTGGLTTFVVDSIVDSSVDKTGEFWWFMSVITTLFAVQFILLLYLSRSSMERGVFASFLVAAFRLPPLSEWTAKASSTDLVAIASAEGYSSHERYAHLAGEFDAARLKNEQVLAFMRRALLTFRLLAGCLLAVLIVALWRLG